MSFWSKLGKGALKVGKIAAPIALGMTGVGLPAAMAVSGGLNALDKKVSGGSWKGALGSGLMGAGMAAGGAGLGKLGGWAGKFGAKAGGGGMPAVQSGLPAGMENVGRVGLPQIPGMAARGVGPSPGGFMGMMGKISQGARTAQDVMGAVGAARGAMGGGQPNYRTPPFNPNAGGGGIMGGGVMGGRGQAIPRGGFNPYDLSPNLGHAIEAGRGDAMRNQPWRTAPFNPNEQYPIYPQGIGPRQPPQY